MRLIFLPEMALRVVSESDDDDEEDDGSSSPERLFLWHFLRGFFSCFFSFDPEDECLAFLSFFADLRCFFFSFSW